METTQLPQVSVSGRIVIEGQLPASVGANPENAPAPPSPARWRFWRWPPESVLAAATVVLAVATFFPAAFTLALVHVASNQTQILSATDQVLHKTANATDEMRILSEATERAWIGPFRAASEPFTAGTAVKISIDYTNTGRLPASFMFAAQAQFLSEQRWNAGEATNMIVPLHKLRCIQNLPNLSDTLKSVAYLTTGLSFYTWTYDSNNPKLLVDSRFAVTDQNITNHDVFMFIGCFVYRMISGEQSDTPHHTVFCYYAQLPVTENSLMNYCTLEGAQYAD